MMKIVFLALLVGIFVVENEAWGPRIRLPRIRVPSVRRIRVPSIRIRVPSIRIPVAKPIGKIFDKASELFANAYKKVCGDPLKSNCGLDLVKRVQNICNGQSCLKRNFKFGKRSIDLSDFNAEPLVNNDSELSKSKRDFLVYVKLAVKGGKIYNQCCLNACRDTDIVKNCV